MSEFGPKEEAFAGGKDEIQEIATFSRVTLSQEGRPK